MSDDRQEELAAVARAIVDSNLYMTLGTADEAGLPWVSPVYYAHAVYSEFFWVSAPDALHSRNLGACPEVSIVVFDSRAGIGTGVGVYMRGIAGEVTGGAELERGIDVFSRRSLEHGAAEWTSEDVRAPAHLRLYRAAVSHHWVLDSGGGRDRRVAVSL
jgi:hypothetical protein